jgi:hypothetical protein
MVTSTQQYDITTQQRELIIIKYMRGHHGCTKADITRGLKGIISKNTIDKLVDEMLENKIVEVKKEKENSRNHNLYLKEDNMLVIVPLQLNEFGNAFESLFFNIIQNIVRIRTNRVPHQNKKEISKMDDANYYSVLQCISILDKISFLYMAISTIDWPNKMQDEDDLRKLFSITFNKLADLRLYVSKTFMHYLPKGYSQLGNMPTLRETYATTMLEASVERFNKANLEKESEPLISSMWNIYKCLKWWAFPEPRFYKWNFSYDEGYKKFIDLCKEHPTQRKDNYTPEDFEKYHEYTTNNKKTDLNG